MSPQFTMSAFLLLGWLSSASCRFVHLNEKLVLQPQSMDRGDAPRVYSSQGLHAMKELVSRYGYSLQEHFATTSDGYILRLFRIPCSRFQHSCAQGRPVAFLQHGLLDSSGSWVILGPKESPAFFMADAGYDVWMGNVRGNTYSTNHTSMRPDSSAFWDFSWDEHALQDLPAMLSTALSTAGMFCKQQLAYVGFSQGTTMALAALSQLPVVQSMVAVAVLLAPVAYVPGMSSSPLLALAGSNAAQVLEALGIAGFMPHTSEMGEFSYLGCMADPEACLALYSLTFGSGPALDVDVQDLARYIKYSAPAGTSVRNMVHWLQNLKQQGRPRMLQFDWGSDCSRRGPNGAPRPCNQQKYNGLSSPPEYNLSAITTPVALYTGALDSIADPQDVRRLVAALPAEYLVAHHTLPTYGHADFILSQHCTVTVYASVLQLLQSYTTALSSPRTATEAAAAA